MVPNKPIQQITRHVLTSMSYKTYSAERVAGKRKERKKENNSFLFCGNVLLHVVQA